MVSKFTELAAKPGVVTIRDGACLSLDHLVNLALDFVVGLHGTRFRTFDQQVLLPRAEWSFLARLDECASRRQLD